VPYPVVLASASPRRKEILARHIPDFEVVPADIDEDALTTPDPWQTAQSLAREKALKVAESHPEALIIAGDTVVAIPNQDNGLLPNAEPHEMLAKPIDHEDAVAMLSKLQGRSHLVITGLCLKWPKGMKLATETTRVHFRPMSRQDIDRYLALGESMDKAGAYAYQGEARHIVDRVEGSETNVIGLPEELLIESLRLVSS